jgi:hypothetical protein
MADTTQTATVCDLDQETILRAPFAVIPQASLNACQSALYL